ncbi:FAD:protein FMN transferase [Spirosoma utsteinense]|uniref:FAD:protein FMN transferase n=1 Tax=Spirosoma utsteinense TaxID=2585773 RepID=A0ABR6W789_9BACT|nr:FAD:protein FMN transferase [Spirosoma utsteinense]MBC3784878.1 thiamine biosynthesis lipoprotein [Spirosoma utsteinense]MBC3792438.1 thiamine biosynthesis lipoprotein [Spirosoma utsteinense]
MNVRISLGFLTRPLLILLLMPGLVIAQPEMARFSFRRGLMGTQFTLTFFAPDSLTARRVNEAVNARMDSLNQVMSDYMDGSEINRLSESSGQNRWVRVSPDLFNVLEKAKTIARQSNGRFDPTIGPLSLLWRRAVRRGEFPAASARRQAHRAVGYRFMGLDSATRSVKLLRPGMRLDVGGIGQGFATDEAALLLRKLGINAFVMDIGGDVLAGEGSWTVALDSTVITLRNAAITTSGDVYRYLDYRGRRYSHIMNPRSGLGLRHFVRVTVQAPDGYRADALTKVFSVARSRAFGWHKSRRLLRRFPGVTVLIVENKRGRLRKWQSAPF